MSGTRSPPCASCGDRVHDGDHLHLFVSGRRRKIEFCSTYCTTSWLINKLAREAPPDRHRERLVWLMDQHCRGLIPCGLFTPEMLVRLERWSTQLMALERES
jgi:hypothetical protein